MSQEFIKLLTHEVQYAALTFMSVIYFIRILWIFRFPAPVESTPPRGSHGAGIRHALFNIAMPWQIESYRKHPVRYLEFVIFHLGVAVAITASIVKPETDLSLMGSSDRWNATPWVGTLCQIFCGAACLTGIFRLLRRVARPEMRAISSPDDYFSIILLTLWLGSASFGVVAGAPAWATVAYFGMTAFFLVYVPFSKISHYLYYPFNKWYVGRHLGHRGVYPKGVRILSPIAEENHMPESDLVPGLQGQHVEE